ncbi:MAG TPA: HNH endonuclease, partial [Microbacteriaceae bacterium]
TLVVRTSLNTLVDGVGHGMIDGLTQPISAGTIRKLAASAGIIPAVLGGDSLPLDLGRTARLFTPGQRIALGERDGGCACCGLDLPYTQAHHINWWNRDTGPTNLSNGVLLCPPCHTRMHNDGWTIHIDEEGLVWFIPPPHVDIDQKPRLGGKARYGLPELITTG